MKGPHTPNPQFKGIASHTPSSWGSGRSLVVGGVVRRYLVVYEITYMYTCTCHSHTRGRNITLHASVSVSVIQDDMTIAPPSAIKALKRLLDVNDLYQILGDTLIHFMREKFQPYGVHCTKSKQDFWHVPVYKRALFFVFFIRFSLGFKSHKNWKKFLQEDYKFNRRCFKRWADKEALILGKSTKLRAMIDARNVEHQKRNTSEIDAFSSDSPMKRRFVVRDESTSDSE